MVTLIEGGTKKEVLQQQTDEFEKYLSEQCLKTTFNEIEVAEFSWYKKLLGINTSNELKKK